MQEVPDIVEVVSRYMPLRRMGSSYAGKCPFHGTETFDAFRVTPRLQRYHCFNCQEKGDAIDFVMKVERVSYPEALRILRIDNHRAVVKKQSPAPQPQARNQPLLGTAIEYWERHLRACPEGMEYLRRRGITDTALLRRLHVGFAPRCGLEGYLKKAGYTQGQMTKEGLVKVVDDQGRRRCYDHFRERVVFPVFDGKGDIVTVTSRSVLKETTVKHLHLPGDITHFYGEDELDSTYTVIVEAPLCRMTLLQQGFKALAAYGTNGLKRQMALRLKGVRSIYLAYDRDKPDRSGNCAGQRGVEKALEIFSTLGMEDQVHSVLLPSCDGDKVDVNDLFVKHGFTKEDFSTLLEDARERAAREHR